ncbi:MAG: integrase arm-type DNA-binding domain-containing protein [Vitreimonas sp.]
MKLTDLKCRKTEAVDAPLKLADGGGLYLHVYPNGKKLWRLAYRYGGKQRILALGPYPHITLLDARKKREAAKDLIREGKDPTAEQRANQAAEESRGETTFAAFADLYLQRLAMAGRADATLKKSRWIVEDLAKELRDQQIEDIRPRDVLKVLRVVEAKGNLETARRMKGVLSCVFRLAMIEDTLVADPTTALRGAILPPQTKHQPAITEPKPFGDLLRVMDGYTGHKTIKLALQLLTLTFPRPGELRCAEWPEVDVSKAIWTIPPERTKMRREHRIPLSRQALAKFEELREITGAGQRCFPSIRSLNNPLSDGALNAALRALGVDGSVHVAHGFRSSASSLLNEHSPFEHDIIERALAHDEPDKVRRAYNRAEYWEERVRMMQWWADYLDKLRVPAALVGKASEPLQADLFSV